MPEDNNFNFANQPKSIEIPLIDIQLINEQDVCFNNPVESFYLDKTVNRGSPFVIGRIISLDKENGTMRVVGISDDINVDVPFTSTGSVSSEFGGDVSLPSANSHVILARTGGNDFYPIAFMRPFSEKYGYGTGIPDEIEEGDLGWVTRGGGRFFVFEGGLVQMESSPNCVRLMTPTEDGEKISDVCREYGLFTDVGNIRAFRRTELADLSSIVIEASESASTAPDPIARVILGSLDDSGLEVGLKLSALKSNIEGVETEGPSIKLLKNGNSEYKADKINIETTVQTDIKSTKINLGDPSAIDPVVLGLQLKARLDMLEAFFNAHVHIAVGTPTDPPKPSFISTIDYLSKTVFTK